MTKIRNRTGFAKNVAIISIWGITAEAIAAYKGDSRERPATVIRAAAWNADTR